MGICWGWVPDDLWLSRNLERHVLEVEYRIIQHGSRASLIQCQNLKIPLLCQPARVLAGQKSLYNGAVNGGECSAESEISVEERLH